MYGTETHSPRSCEARWNPPWIELGAGNGPGSPYCFAYVVYAPPEPLPLRAAREEYGGVVVQPFHRRIELQERVCDRQAVRVVQRPENLAQGRHSLYTRAQAAWRRAYRDHIRIADDGVQQRERDDDLDPQGRDVSVDGDVFHRVEQVQVALGRLGRIGGGDCRDSSTSETDSRRRLSSGRTPFLNDIEAGVGNVVVFQLIFFGLGECADEDWVVLWRDERDSVETKWWRHAESVQVTRLNTLADTQLEYCKPYCFRQPFS